jgi:hypothetical protein
MVSVTRDNSETVFTIKGFHKVLALASEIRIPNSHVLGAYSDPSEVERWRGVRAFGTYFPTLISAGTFFQAENGAIVFMDVVDINKTIIVELEDEKFNRLIIEVEDPDAAISLLRK